MYARCVSNSQTTGTETSPTNDHDRISRKLCWQQLDSVCSNCSVRHRICKYAERRQIVSIFSNWPSTSLRRRCIKVGLSESHIMRSMSHFRSIDKFQHDTSGKRARGHELPWGFSQTEHRLRVDTLHVEPVTSHLGLSMFYNLRESMLAKSV